MDQDLVDTLCVVLRDVVALYKSEGPTLIVPFSLKKTGGTQSTFYHNLAQKLGGPGPPCPLGNYIPASNQNS